MDIFYSAKSSANLSFIKQGFVCMANAGFNMPCSIRMKPPL